MKTICFFNPFDGVGKTKLSIKFYDYLSNKGYRVKGIDCDQKNKTFSKVLSGQIPGEESNVQSLPLNDLTFTIDLLRNNYDFAIVDTQSFSIVSKEFIPVDYLFFIIVPKFNDLEIAKETLSGIEKMFNVREGVYLIVNNVPFDGSIEEQIDRRNRILSYMNDFPEKYPLIQNFAYNGWTEQFLPMFDEIHELFGKSI